MRKRSIEIAPGISIRIPRGVAPGPDAPPIQRLQWMVLKIELLKLPKKLAPMIAGQPPRQIQRILETAIMELICAVYPELRGKKWRPTMPGRRTRTAREKDRF